MKANSPAYKAGVRAGDLLVRVEQVNSHSQGDVQTGLHRLPWAGTGTIQFLRAGKLQSALLDLPPGWKKTDLSWRKSVQKEKDKLKLGDKPVAPKEPARALQPAAAPVPAADAPLPARTVEPDSAAPAPKVQTTRLLAPFALGLALALPLLAGALWLGYRRIRQR